MFQFIPPREIGARIMSLIDDAERNVVIVSPFNTFTRWDKMNDCILEAIERGVHFRWFVRDDANDEGNDVYDLGIEPIFVPNLHAKLYMNERRAIVTSFNMSWHAETRTIDIAHETTDHDDLSQLRRFVEQYVAARALSDEQEPSPAGQSEAEPRSAQQRPKYVRPEIDWSSAVALFDGIESSLKQVPDLELRRTPRAVEVARFMHDDLRALVEHLGRYLRVGYTFAYRGPYKRSRLLYEVLSAQVGSIEAAVGHDVNPGPQMRRLKFDFGEYALDRAEQWGDDAAHKVAEFTLQAGHDLARRLNDAQKLSG